MKVGLVVGHVWATKKDEKLNGFKFMVVKDTLNKSGNYFVAVDQVGAGIGDKVLVATGSSARKSFEKESSVDAAIVGVVDEIDLVEEK
ncbi:MAG: EutN/CcmL family microcompartment protein [Mycoplasmatales bacterium]